MCVIMKESSYVMIDDTRQSWSLLANKCEEIRATRLKSGKKDAAETPLRVLKSTLKASPRIIKKAIRDKVASQSSYVNSPANSLVRREVNQGEKMSLRGSSLTNAFSDEAAKRRVRKARKSSQSPL